MDFNSRRMTQEQVVNAMRQNINSDIDKAEETLFGKSEMDLFFEEIEKAHNVGDLFFSDGKTYVWTEYAPGKFDWHIQKSTKSVTKGRGVDGVHGLKALNKLYTKIDKTFTDPKKMLLKRTPNGLWRLHYDGNDAGLSIDGDIVTEEELKKDEVLYQDRNVVDNFDLVGNYMEFKNPDDVYFVQIIKRWKDNKDKPNADNWRATGKAKGSYHSGAEYMEYYLIHNPQELAQLKGEIMKKCTYNNARAYISINSRSQTQTNQYMSTWNAKYPDPNSPQRKYAEAILYGQAKTGKAWKNERFRVLLDIDCIRDDISSVNGKKVNTWDETRRRLNAAGVKIATEYETPSGGLHLILNNKNNRNLRQFYDSLKDFDNGKDLGKQAKVHPSEDTKMVLYSNVDTAGY